MEAEVEQILDPRGRERFGKWLGVKTFWVAVWGACFGAGFWDSYHLTVVFIGDAFDHPAILDVHKLVMSDISQRFVLIDPPCWVMLG